MSCDVWNLVYFGSASQPAYHSQNSRAAQPAGYPHKGKAKDDKGNGRRNGKGMPKGKCGNGKSNSKGSGKIAKATAKAYVKAWHMQKQKHGKRKGGNSSSNSIDVRRAATPVDGDSSAARPADDLPHGKGNDKTALDFRTALRQVQIGTKDVSPTDSHARNPNTDVAIKQLSLNAPTPSSKGLRFGNFVQIRDVINEELEAIWSGKKNARNGLDDAVSRGNKLLRKFESANR